MDAVYAWVVPWEQRSRTGTGQLLAEAAGWLLNTDASQVLAGHDELGRPVARAAAGQVWVSVSYGPQSLAVAASLAGPVGIDIEGVAGATARELGRRWFAAAEAQWLSELPETDQPEAFLLLWTAKEALGKALGIGLRGGGLRRPVPLPPVVDGVLRPLPDGLWLAHPVVAEPLVLAIATGPGTAPDTSIELRELSGHGALARSTVRSRTSLPVVVRGS